MPVMIYHIFFISITLFSVPAFSLDEGYRGTLSLGPEPRTNGERMALGLPPLPPKRFAEILAKRHKRPTRVRVHGRHAAPSPSPVAGSQGQPQFKKLKVTRCEDGAALGYVARPFHNRVKPFGLTPSESGALQVRWQGDDAGPVTLLMKKPASVREPYLGLSPNQSDTAIGSGSSDVLKLVASPRDVVVPRSNMWIVNQTQLIPYYANDGGSVPQLKFVYSPAHDQIAITSNVTTFDSMYTDSIDVTLTLL
ncbi:hypothetical protein PC9H_001826 [Pleurotus ostreatus]|uniref:Uncharacterized protein n=1 Tax=Pleurotus ostreatus TaxID=5322 RepID=A0A8H7DKT6_PLEOS|nr:uncharacterized protein PC9H_001826 [Pleurotus ostreatus]KAF7419239.1 hypothetical protein PC9H_001826 [Pleurotus ostreatus]KAJ8690009.1 hypothetical protein PTI98_012854 [Pleurotus ostreatus]